MRHTAARERQAVGALLRTAAGEVNYYVGDARQARILADAIDYIYMIDTDYFYICAADAATPLILMPPILRRQIAADADIFFAASPFSLRHCH